MSAPNDIMRSTYSFPSTSKTCDARPRSRTTGPGENTAAPRDGEFTPSTSDCCARAKYCAERVRDLEVKSSKISDSRWQIVLQGWAFNLQSEIFNRSRYTLKPAPCNPHPQSLSS